MNTTALRESIIQKIRCTDDDELLNYLNQLLRDNEDQKTCKNLEFEKKMQTESEAVYRTGRIFSNENVQATLYSRILAISDEEFLNEMISLIDQKDKTIYHTTPEQKEAIIKGRDQIASGQYFTNEQVEKEINEWLQKE